MKTGKPQLDLLEENEELRIRLQEAEETLQAIREGAVDALIVSGPKGEQVFTLVGEDVVYRRMVETMSEAGLTTTPEGKILFCNERFAAMLKRPMEEILGRNLDEFVHKLHRKDFAALLIGIHEKSARKYLVFSAADGTLVPTRVSANLLQQGDAVSICIVAMDMTELEASEEIIRQISKQRAALQQNELNLRKLNRILKALSDSTQVMIHAKDESDYLQEVCKVIDKDCGYAMVLIAYAENNPAKTVRPVAYAGFEKGYHEALKTTWSDTQLDRGPAGTAIRTGKASICTNILTDPVFKSWSKEATKRGYVSSIALPLIFDGKTFGSITLYSKEPDPFSKDEVKLLTELASDLSYGIIVLKSRVARDKAENESKLLTEELKRSNCDLEQFAYVASHDLREPLRAVAGFNELLRSQYKAKLDDKAGEYIELTISGVKRMEDLLNGLLEYSRVGTHGQTPVSIPVETILNASVANLQKSISETDAVITRDELPTVMADDRQLTQVFQNLIGNAIKFHGGQRPQIHIGCQKHNAGWLFSVRDNGIGIDPRFNNRIFLIFQRLHTHQKYPGTGIGLAICKKIIERHGGKIWVESKPQIGSTFYFTIPDREETSNENGQIQG